MMETAVSALTRNGPEPHTVDTSRYSRSEAFEELMLPHLGAAHNLARWLIRSDQDAEDVVQEAYLRAFRFFDGYRGGDGKSWILEIVRNTCFTWLRRQQREGAVPFDETISASSGHAGELHEVVADEERKGILRNCLERLPDAFREVLVMRELEEMTYRQISEVVALPVGTVMSRLSRARTRLEECVAGRRRKVRK